MLTFTLPSQLAALAEGKRTITVDASSLGEAFAKLDSVAPMLRSQLFDAAGSIRQFVGLFVDNRQVLALGDGSQPVGDGSNIVIVQAVAGG